MPQPIHGLVDHLFRHSAGQMVSTLTRILGSENLALAEEVVQEALIKALQSWSVRGVPDNPQAWLFQVARNKALDELRRQSALRNREGEIVAAFSARTEEQPGFAHELRDDQLRMMLMCCHPAIPEEGRIALTLKTVGGFSVEEIARAFLAKPETVAQRIVRAKRSIRQHAIPMEMPSRQELPARLQSLHTVLYLMFTEGFNATGGIVLVRKEVCTDTIRLTRLVAEHPLAGSPAAQALLALMLLQAARFPARIDDSGELAVLADQDRSQWDPSLIGEGMRALDRSATGEQLTPYHIEAAIAAVHGAAPDFESTDWERLLELYEELMAMKPSPVVALNRAVALAMCRGPAAGIAAAEEVEQHHALRDYLPLASTLGELWLRLGDRDRAAEYFSHALSLPCTTPEKRFLLRKLRQVSAED